MPLRFSLRELEVFCAIAQHDHVHRAAEAVALTQSAASQALARLEAALGRPLFDRRGRRLVLNDNGRQLLPRARALLDQAQEVQTLWDEGGPALNLGASSTIANYLLPAQLAAYRQAHPGAPVQLTVGNTREVVAAVAAMEVDFGLIEGVCSDSHLQVERWRADELVVIAAPAHALARQPTRAQLAAAPWLLREPGSGTREEVERWLLTHLGSVRADMELGNSEAIKRAVAAGLGLSCLSRSAVADFLASGALVEVATGLPPLVRQLCLVRHRERPATRGMQAFLALASLVEANAAGSAPG